MKKKLRSKKATNILDIPNEILVQILEFLPLVYIRAVRQSCSKLYRISHLKEIMNKQKFVFELADFRRNEEILNRIIEMGISCLNIELCLPEFRYDTKLIELEISKIIIFLGSKINSLKLVGHWKDLSFLLVEDILLTCGNLKELCLHSMELKWPGKSRIKSDNVNTKLEVLKIIDCYFSSDHAIDMILNYYPAIKTIQLHSHLNLSLAEENNMKLADEHILHRITTYNKLIQELDIHSVDEYHGYSKTAFVKLASSELKLRSICITAEHNISKTEFKTLFVKQNNLKELVIKNCEQFDEECLQYLVTLCSKLEHLCLKTMWKPIKFSCNLFKNTQIGINLKVLEFENVCLSGGNAAGLNFPNLEHVKLMHCRSKDEENHLKFLENCRLKHFQLKGYKIQDIDIVRIISPSQNSLITLGLNGSRQSQNSVNGSIIRFSKLEELYIDASRFLTSVIVQNFDFPCLKRLDFNSYPVNVHECKMIITGCPLLEELCLWPQEKLEDRTLLNLSKPLYFLRLFKRNNHHGFYKMIFFKRQKLKKNNHCF